LSVTIDYSLDTNNFFDTQAKRDLLASAFNEIAGQFSDSLDAIVPGPSGFGFDNTWTAKFTHPGAGTNESVVDPTISLDEIVIYAGGRDLGGSPEAGYTLGVGEKGGFTASGTGAFLDNVKGRGQTGALASPATDFGPWGGSITFTTNAAIAWHFETTTTGLDANESDFYSVALHEVAHLLGFGTASSWSTYVDTGTATFTGPASVAEYDIGGNVPLHSGLKHWAEGVSDEGQEAAMDPNITNGTRKLMTPLDFAGLVDVGWEQILTPDIQLQSFTANGFTTLTINYEITNGPAPAFDISFYRSADEQFGGESSLDSVTISDDADLTTGIHTLNLTLGTGLGEIQFPGAGVSDTTDDDFLIAVADPTNVVTEFDADPFAEDNTVAFAGVYHVDFAAVYVWGSSGNDSVTVEPSSVKVTYNSISYTYSDSTVTSVRIRGKGGNDTIDGTTISKSLWIHGGDGDDSIKGGASIDSIAGGAGNDNMQGRAGDDLYTFDTDSSLGSDTILETTGLDKLDFSSTSTQSIVLNLGSTSQQTVNSNLKLTLQAGGAIENLTGGDQNDTLTGNTQANTLSGRGGDDVLAGGSNNDLYLFDTDLALGSDTVTDQSGIDLLDFSSTTSLGVTVNIGITTPQVVNANLTLTLSSATSIENILGSALSDSLTGNTLQNILRGNAGNDTLAGSTGNDTYQFDCDAGLGNDTINDSAGTDTIDFTGTDTKTVTLDLSLTSLQAVNSNLGLTILGANIENVTGGSLDDVLRGNDLANSLKGNPGNDLLEGRGGNDTITGSAGNDTQDGGSGNDTYSFFADAELGHDDLSDSGGGTDALSFSTSASAVSIDLSLTTDQVVNGFLIVTLSSDTAFENLVGGAGNDTLIGNSAKNAITGGGGNDLLSGLSNDDMLTGSNGDDQLIGGAGNDTYLFDTDAGLGADTIDESGGGSADLLDFTSTTTIGVSVDLLVASVQTINANLTLALGGGTAIENLTGGSGNDLLIGNDLNNSIKGNAGNDSIVGSVGNDTITGSAGDDSLAGGLGDDTYSFFADSALGTDTLDESAGGIDLLSFSTTTNQAVSVDLSQGAFQVVNPFLSLILSSDATLENITGGSKNDTLIGNELANVITGGNGNDVLQGAGGNDTFTGGLGNDSIAGAAGDDRYLFDADSALGTDRLDESGGGSDTLDFSATTSQGISIDLNLATSQLVNANLSLLLTSASDFENVMGGTKNDTIYGNALANILVGNNGNDSLYGRDGRDLISAGVGIDFVRGEGDDDILIAGKTTHDTNAAALALIMAEWTSGNDYVTRTTNLRTGAAGVMLKAKNTALNDSNVDDLDGGLAADWYFASLTDTVAPLEPGELKETL